MRTIAKAADRHPPASGTPSPVDVGPSDAELVRSAAAGDREAWATLYGRYAPVVHGVLLARVRKQDADDLTHDVFVQAMRRLGDVRDGAAVGGWLAAIARNMTVSLARRTVRMEPLADQDRAAVSESAPREELQEASRILGVIRALPEAYRETLVLRLVEGMTGPQIAERMGMTHGSVRVNLHRGMQLLREKLEGKGAAECGGTTHE